MNPTSLQCVRKTCRNWGSRRRNLALITAVMLMLTAAVCLYSEESDGKGVAAGDTFTAAVPHEGGTILMTFRVLDATALTVQAGDGSNPAIATGISGELTVPATVTNPATGQTCTVTAIGDNAFASCFNLTKIELPGSLTVIGSNAFYACLDLTALDVPAAVTSIGDYFATQCQRLQTITVAAGSTSFTTVDNILYTADLKTLIQCPAARTGSVTVPDGTVNIAAGAFQCCGITAVTFPAAGLLSIGDGAFEFSTLESAAVPDSVISVGEQAFAGCYKMTSLSLGAGVTSLGEGFAHVCRSLTSLTVAAGNLSFVSMDGVVYNYAKTDLIQCAGGTTGTLTVPNGVTTIGGYAFYYTGLTAINLPATLKTIGPLAFRDCSKLTTITIPAAVTSIGDKAFQYCNSLTSIEVADGSGCFQSFNGLLYDKTGTVLICCPAGVSAVPALLDTVTTIKGGAFMLADNLTTITFPDSVTTFEEQAIFHCAGLQTVKLGAHVTADGLSGGFILSCTALQTITVADGNTELAVADGILYTADMKTLILCPAGRSGALTVPDGVETIAPYAFNFSRLSALTLPDSVTAIGSYAFEFSDLLSSLNLPAALKTVGPYILDNCTNFHTLTCGSFTRAEFDDMAFAGIAFYAADGVTQIAAEPAALSGHTFTSADATRFVREKGNDSGSSDWTLPAVIAIAALLAIAAVAIVLHRRH